LPATEREPSVEAPAGEARAEVEPEWRVPEILDDRYRIETLIGRGGMGEVWCARDLVLGRRVAVKLIALDPDELARSRFMIEARATARLQHRNVLTIHDVGEIDGRPYLVMELLLGTTLDKLGTRLHWTQVVELGIELSCGLAAAHRSGVLHRDIKPNNAILTDDGHVKLLDFGLAKLNARRSTTIPPPSAWQERSASPRPANENAPASLRGERACPAPPEAAGDAGPRTLTDPGVLVGTPDYMPPESWRGEPATPQSDVYSLGALLFELCAGYPPHREVASHARHLAVQQRDAPLLTGVEPTVDPAFAAIVARCLSRNPAHRYASGEELHEALKRLELPACRGPVPRGNPYRGKRCFEAEHRAVFFGRQNEIRTVVERLRDTSLVVVAGDSGVGKSSLCRAGVLPAVEDGSLGGGCTWRVATLVPDRTPVLALAAALAPWLGMNEEAAARLMREQPSAIARTAGERLGTDTGLVLFVDQLEELVGDGGAGEGAIVARVLGHLATAPRAIRVLMTVRSDALDHVVDLPGLGREIPLALYVLKPLSCEAIREAVVGPARAAEVTFAPESLVESLVGAATRTRRAWPLVQIVLAELWEARDPRTDAISAAALDEIGGIDGAIARHAEEVILSMTAVNRAASRRILTRLVGPEGKPIARFEQELLSDELSTWAALDGLVKGRLLVASESAQGTAYEIAHEALIQRWETLRRWLAEQAETRVLRSQIAEAARAWERQGRAREALWSAEQLVALRDVEPDDMDPGDLAFIEASKRESKRARGGAVAGVARRVTAAREWIRARVAGATQRG
jgi:serine/threonine protein kinase